MRPGSLVPLVPLLCLAQAPQRPILVADAANVNFGRIPPGGHASHRFVLRNAGQRNLVLDRIQPSCGCTTTVVGKTELAPGETTDLEVSFDGSGFTGPVRKTVEITSNDPVNPKYLLTFSAIVGGVVQPTSGEVRFQDLTPKDRKTASFLFRSGTGQPIRVDSVDLSKAPWLGVATREEGAQLWVDLDLKAKDLPPGRLGGTDTIDLHVANPQPSVAHLDVIWELRPPVTIDPPRVAWAGLAGQELARSVVLESREQKPFRILAIRTSDPSLTVAGGGAAAPRQELRFALAGHKAGTFNGRALVTLDTPGHPELEIRVAATLQ